MHKTEKAKTAINIVHTNRGFIIHINLKCYLQVYPDDSSHQHILANKQEKHKQETRNFK